MGFGQLWVLTLYFIDFERVTGAMTTREPWYCQTCQIKVRAASNFCGQCGQGWSYTPTHPAQPWQAWDSSGWEAPPSPRGRKGGAKQQPWGKAKSPRRRLGKDGKGDGKQTPKGVGKPKDGPPTAPTTAMLPTPPQRGPPSAPSGAATAPVAVSSADTALQQLVAALNKNRDDLPQGVRELLDTQAAEDTKNHAKSLHKLVATQSAARRQLKQTRTNRQDYIREWASYVGSVCQMWQQQLEEKDKILATFADSEAQWEAQLSEATRQIARLASEPGSHGPIDVDAMDDEDQDEQEAMVDEHAKQDAQRQQAVETMKAAEAKITASLLEANAAVAQQAAVLAKADRERSPRRKSDKDKPDAASTADDAKAAGRAGATKPPQ